jgi:hypothetical protein
MHDSLRMQRLIAMLRDSHKQRIIPVIFLFLLLAGCSDNFKRSPDAHLSPDPKHGYAVRLDYSYRSFGGPCNFPQKPQTISESDWILADTTNGTVSADHLTLWHGKSPNDQFGWAQQALRGSMIFSNGWVHINFQVPDYRDDDSIRKHDQYRLNGDYRLEAK